MNNNYKLIWSHTKQCFVVASEIAKSAGKRSCRVLNPILSVSFSLSLILSSSLLHSAPQDGVVSQGSASIAVQGATTTITQTSPKAIIDWKSFNIGVNETTTFKQPSVNSVVLNRIHDSSGSQIMGQLNANGHVFLVNPNGVTFARGAHVNVGGLVASTLDINDADFMQGNYQFKAAGNQNGKIINYGHINANTVALLGNQVTNDGWIVASASTGKGDIALVAANDITISFGSNQHLGIKVSKGTLNALVDNKQLIQADGGKILLRAAAADSLLGAVVNSSGTVRARSLNMVDGEILLLADMHHGTTAVSGILDASAPVSGNGGFIETSAATVNITKGAFIDTRALIGDFGEWLIDPINYTIAVTGGDITGAELSNRLATSNITIETSPVAGGGLVGAGTAEAGYIMVNDDITWSTANTRLTLNAKNNIYVNKSITASGDGAGIIFDTGFQNSLTDTPQTQADLAASKHLQFGDEGIVTLTGADPIYQVDGRRFQVINGNNSAIDGDTALNELQNIQDKLSGKYVLGVDIDATATASWDGGKGFKPIGQKFNGATLVFPFSGYFSGAGHTINGLTINRITQYSTSQIGLFGMLAKGHIRDVGLTNVNVTGLEASYKSGAVGALVGASQHSSIKNSYATGKVTGFGPYTGGLIGDNRSSPITASYTKVKVVGSGYSTGGLIGYNLNSAITESYTTGEVVNNGAQTGGLIGFNRNSAITDSYTTGKVVSTNGHATGGLIGYDDDGSTITRTYTTGNVSGDKYAIGGLIGLQREGTITESYAIGNVDSNDNSGGLVGVKLKGSIINSYATGNVYGKKLAGGLIGSLAQSSTITESYATGEVTSGDVYNSSAGGLVGANNSTITASYATGKVIGSGRSTGGLVGENYSYGNIIESYATGQVVGHGYFTGGLIGFNHGSTNTVTRSYAIGKVTGTEDVSVDNATGGLIGYQQSGSIIESYARGNVTGNGNTGGLIGKNRSGTITESFASGNVSGDKNVGGLVGRSTAGIITKSYAWGNVSGDTQMGGLVGEMQAQGSIEDSYAWGDVTSLNGDELGGLVGKFDNGSITTSYTTGRVSSGKAAPESLGGLVGSITRDDQTSISHSYFSESTDQSQGIGSGSAKTVTKLNVVDSKLKASYVGFDLRNTYAVDDTVWRIYDGHITPVLTSALTQAAALITGVSRSAEYSGEKIIETVSAAAISVANNIDTLAISGAIRLSTTSKNVGVYTGNNIEIESDLYSTIYDIDNQNIIVDGTSHLTITPKILTATGTTVDDKVYDANTIATVNTDALTDIIAGDVVNTTSTGIFIDANAGVNKAVLVMHSLDNANYQLTTPGESLTATITPKTLTATGITVDDKIYDGYADARVDADALTGVIAGEAVNNTSTGRFSDANVADNKAVTISYSLDNSNYQLSNISETLRAAITPKTLTAFATIKNKIYDGSTSAIVDTSGLTGVIAWDLVNHSTSGSFIDANAGVNKAAIVTHSIDNPNYQLLNKSQTLGASITPKTLTLIATKINNKEYDANTDATINSVELLGIVAGDVVNTTSTGIFIDANAGVNKAVLVMHSFDNANYQLSTPGESLTATITPKTLTATGITVDDKIYDGYADARVDADALTGVIAGEVVNNTSTGRFSDANVADNKAVTISYSLDNRNYQLSNINQTLRAAITPKTLTAFATINNKIYDASTRAIVDSSALTGVIAGDVVNHSTSGSFIDANAGVNKGVIVTHSIDNTNYQLLNKSQTLGASITPKTLTLIATKVNDKEYDANTDATINSAVLTGIIAGDVVNTISTGIFIDANAGVNKAVLVMHSLDNANYQLTTPGESLTASITPKALTVEGTQVSNKLHDANTIATVTTDPLTGIITGEVVNKTTTGRFSDAAVGTNKHVKVSHQIDNLNYQLVNAVENLQASILQAPEEQPPVEQPPIVQPPIFTLPDNPLNIATLTINSASNNAVVPEVDNVISRNGEFDPNPFGPTAAGGVTVETYYDGNLIINDQGIKRSRELSEANLNCEASSLKFQHNNCTR